ncbi:RNA-directed DNA polymerase from transposon X-element [Paramuricea clavata]|uniref:RNA-directed DNA polymerase from transposon X-element n=1 Tax=Paramuricea clavata TaxID=317549 RepID=A0A6S7GBV5_PARCT|nr:RNA-directed DNA polymerase from transposon X-element [Paramuricea clavata]
MDMEEVAQVKQNSLANIEEILSSATSESSKKQHQKFQQMKKRRATKLFKESKFKKRAKTNQGNKSLIDSKDEKFIAKSIEDKATYHGRRHDLVMYTNRRVKSVEAKQHRGKGLFCTKKPSKVEDDDNKNTHYQRSHVKNVKLAFFGKDFKDNSHICFMRSIDDKAYLRLGTSEGFLNTRNKNILTLTDVEKAKKLPKYDCPEKLVYQTPGSHHIFTKECTMSNDKDEEKLLTKDDNHFVFI